MANVNSAEYDLMTSLIGFKLQIELLDDILNEYQDCETQRQTVQSSRHRLEEEYTILYKNMNMVEVGKGFNAAWESIRNAYVNVIAKTEQVLAKNKAGTAQPSSSRVVTEIAHFKGQPEDWTRFKDAFLSRLSTEPNLNDNDKLRLLQDCVSGKVKSAIELCEDNGINFETAWNQLRLAYEETRRFVSSQATALVSMSREGDDSMASISRLINDMQLQIRWLQIIPSPRKVCKRNPNTLTVQSFPY